MRAPLAVANEFGSERGHGLGRMLFISTKILLGFYSQSDQCLNAVVSQFEISAPWVESGPLAIGHTDKCDAQIVSNLTVRRRLKLF